MLRWGAALVVACATATPSYVIESDLLTKDACAAIIDAVERFGFSQAPDTIDKDDPVQPPMVQADVFEQAEVRAPEVMALVGPHLPRLVRLVDRAKRARGVDTATRFDWIFVRKYAATSRRDRLRAHKDGNLWSVNVFLNSINESFVSGGLFLADGPADSAGTAVWSDEFLDGDMLEVHHPPQVAGWGIVHDNHVWHGIAPLASGVKYSLLLFADMSDAQIEGDVVTIATFTNAGDGGPLSLAWCGSVDEPGDCVPLETIDPGATAEMETYADHVFRATDARGRSATYAVEGLFREAFEFTGAPREEL